MNDCANLSAPAAAASPAESPANYEAALEELERLVERLESGDTPLERLLDDYRRGAELLGFCRARLAALEQQIKLLDGEVLKPWEES